MILNIEWCQDSSLENVYFLPQYQFLQALKPVLKDHGKHLALMLSPLSCSVVRDIVSEEVENINKGNNSMYQIPGIIGSHRIC